MCRKYKPIIEPSPDFFGQLIREITGSKTYKYAYDSKGNILTRELYSNGILSKTDTFTYGADIWEDRLTVYNNQSITYDSIGNPTTYLGAELTWRGRELAGYIDFDKNKQISYSYDVDGMRYRKVVTENNKTATYDYVYSDGTLILLTYTENGVHNTARFVYDSWGELRGFMLNDSATYLYLKNAQGDITGIVDENGAVLLTYSYTAWGEVSFTATNMQNLILAGTLSKVNPFTYRGYCYDYDIGMYYLQSRYYDPEICRFINADSTDYLGATGTLLSYNLFAYCENDGVNAVDYEGYYLFRVFKKSCSHAKRRAYARELMRSPNAPEFFVLSYIKDPIYGSTKPNYVYDTTRQSKKLRKIYVYYNSFNIEGERVIGTFIYKTVAEWELYIIARHTLVSKDIKKELKKVLGVSDKFWDTYLEVLDEVLSNTPIGKIIEKIYDVIEPSIEYIEQYRDGLDKYIMNCLKNIKKQKGENVDKYYVMFYWSVNYQFATYSHHRTSWQNRKYISMYTIFK